MKLNKEESHTSSARIARIVFLKHSFHTLSLTLLLPLSFLLLARLPHSSSSPFAPLLGSLVSVLSASSLLYSLSGRLLTPGLAISWPFLFVFQLSVALGIELTITEPTVKPTPTTRAPWIERAVFFLGLYETMLHWSRTFVRPVVDDSIFRVSTDEGAVDKAGIGVAFGALWLRMLRDDIEPLLAAAGREGLVTATSGSDAFFLWFVSYTTVVIGVVRVAEVVFGVGKLMMCLILCGGELDDAHLSSFPEGDDQCEGSVNLCNLYEFILFIV